MTVTASEKVRENRVRRMATRQGLRLVRSRRRDPLALDYGLYRLIDAGGSVLTRAKNLDDIEQALIPTDRGVVVTDIPDERTRAAALIDRLSEAADFNWGTHYPCLRDCLGDLASDLQSGKVSPTIEQIVAVVAREARAAQVQVLHDLSDYMAEYGDDLLGAGQPMDWVERRLAEWAEEQT